MSHFILTCDVLDALTGQQSELEMTHSSGCREANVRSWWGVLHVHIFSAIALCE